MFRSKASQSLFNYAWSRLCLRGLKSKPKIVAVELLQDVENVGARGSIVSITRGYAWNYLVPLKKAKLSQETVDKGKKTEFVSSTTQDLRDKKADEAQLDAVLRKLLTSTLKFKLAATDEGVLHKSVTHDDVVAAIAQQLRVKLHPGWLDWTTDVHSTGEHEVRLNVKFPGDEDGTLKLQVSSTTGKTAPELAAAAAGDAAEDFMPA